jgi:hypothetical protein
MSKTLSNAPILTQLSVATKCLQGVVASLALEAVMTGQATLSPQHVAMLAESVDNMSGAVREALAIEVERLDLADKAQTNAAPSQATVQEFLNQRRENQRKAAEAYAQPRDEAGFEELKGMADQPAVERETVGVKFVPIGRISLPADATPEQFMSAVLGAIMGGRGGDQPTAH